MTQTFYLGRQKPEGSLRVRLNHTNMEEIKKRRANALARIRKAYEAFELRTTAKDKDLEEARHQLKEMYEQVNAECEARKVRRQAAEAAARIKELEAELARMKAGREEATL